MALPNLKFTVTSSRLEIVTPGVAAPPPNRAVGRSQALITNNGPGTIYLGDEAVTSADGFGLIAGASLAVAPLGPNDRLYAICAAGQSADVRVLRHDPEF